MRRFDFGRRIAVEKEMRKSPAVMYQQAASGIRGQLSKCTHDEFLHRLLERIWANSEFTVVFLLKSHNCACSHEAIGGPWIHVKTLVWVGRAGLSSDPL